MYHLTKSDPATILSEGLRVDAPRHFKAQSSEGFNPPGIYLYDRLAITRRLWPRSTVHLLEVDADGLKLERDRWGGEGAWRATASIPADRIAHVHTYQPFEPPLAQQPERNHQWTPH